MFGWGTRRRQRQYLRELKSQVDSIQTRIVVMVRRELLKQYGTITASQMAQATVDRLFARPAALGGEYIQLIDSLSNEIVRENKFVRDAAFVTLAAMLELDGANNDFKAKRRILETLQWLKQYGEEPLGITLQEINEELLAEGDLLTIARHEELEESK
jgi:hypothetical protein